MAERLARIYGTEEDKVNCPFYLKMGACRHGDRCSRIHNKPGISQTILIQNMYVPPPQEVGVDGQPLPQDPRDLQEHFEDFYEDLCEELLDIGGDLETVEVCQNLSDHLRGNVYCKFDREEDAQKALAALMGRHYAGRPILPQFSPVLDFREARCRQFEESECQRGGYCNFMHLKHVPSRLRRKYRLIRPDRDRDRDDHGRGGYDRGRSGGGYHDRGPPTDRGYDRGYPAPRDYDGRARPTRPDPREDARPDRERDYRDDRRAPPPGPVETDEERRQRIAAWNMRKRGAEAGASEAGHDGTSDQPRESNGDAHAPPPGPPPK